MPVACYSNTQASLLHSCREYDTFLPTGSYQYTFVMRGAFPGQYNVLPAQGEMLYFPDVWGRSGGQTFAIGE